MQWRFVRGCETQRRSNGCICSVSLTSGFALFTEHQDIIWVSDLTVSGGFLFWFQKGSSSLAQFKLCFMSEKVPWWSGNISWQLACYWIGEPWMVVQLRTDGVNNMWIWQCLYTLTLVKSWMLISLKLNVFIATVITEICSDFHAHNDCVNVVNSCMRGPKMRVWWDSKGQCSCLSHWWMSKGI